MGGGLIWRELRDAWFTCLAIADAWLDSLQHKTIDRMVGESTRGVVVESRDRLRDHAEQWADLSLIGLDAPLVDYSTVADLEDLAAEVFFALDTAGAVPAGWVDEPFVWEGLGSE
ncbi:hypothetical protein SEA_MISHA28_48 [Mycobacterium phage Misha28]|nr:hypothetical protein SEA_MISHA28_48 [Mycobacterium phage Misha28]AVP42439.1 hypothetical protein SEA_TOOTSIEPOP_48 [Mycobacterium phage TootsiePop]QKO03233.1 hypothetical protein SEA_AWESOMESAUCE_50 [Mycobacterium phage Awesomesauce]